MPDSVAVFTLLASCPLKCSYLGDIDGECSVFEGDKKKLVFSCFLFRLLQCTSICQCLCSKVSISGMWEKSQERSHEMLLERPARSPPYAKVCMLENPSLLSVTLTPLRESEDDDVQA